jgi:imidazole glycerol-phosphate synthase subunit HisH
VHSYYPEVADESLALCRTDYGVPFIAGIARKNLMAVQFHPEKSQEVGLALLKNSIEHLAATL